MKILFLSFYFHPDLSAGSFRATSLANALAKESGGQAKVDVFTTLPNRYSSFVTRAETVERLGNVEIRRVKVPRHRSGMLDQSFAFLCYAAQVLGLARRRKYDLVFATSSRLMTGVLGAFLARCMSCPFYLDIRDIFTDTIGDLLAEGKLRFVLRIFKQMEIFAVRTASKINVVSGGFEGYFRAIAPEKQLSVYTNGIDDDFVGVNYETESRERRLILYAGNIGEGQGLHKIIPGLARRLGDADFLIVGDGGARAKLQRALVESKVGNVRIHPPVPRKKLIELYRQADCLFLHLNDHAAFKKVLPSKIFEYAATGKPILAGVSGYAREFLIDNVENAAVFEPGDVMGGVAALRKLRMEVLPRDEFVQKFLRSGITREMARDVLSLLADCC